MKNDVLWDVRPCVSCENRRFRGTYDVTSQKTPFFRLYNMIPIQIKQRQDLSCFIRKLQAFFLRYSSCSVDEFMSQDSLSVIHTIQWMRTTFR
jgi:hypothetical protein